MPLPSDLVICMASPLVAGGCQADSCPHKYPHAEDPPFCGSKECGRQNRFYGVWCVSIDAMLHKHRNTGENSKMPYKAMPKIKHVGTKDVVVRKHKCRFCERVFVYTEDSDDPRCPKCDTAVADTIELITDTNDKVNYKTHSQYRWHCKSCKRKGILWEKKTKLITSCPQCGEAISPPRRLPDRGECASIWGLPGPHTVAPKKYRLTCQNCGRAHGYFIRKPTTCARCGESL